MKRFYALFIALFILSAACFGMGVSADCQASTYTVVKGDTLWKISLRYNLKLDDLINANPQFKNPDLIYPGDTVYIPTTTSDPDHGSDSDVLSFEEEVVDLVNEIRSQNGLGKLTLNPKLCRVARYKSQDMHDKHYFSHTSPTYGSPFDMMKQFGISYRTAGENIAMGYRTPQAVVNGWMNSSGHRANILNASYTEIGVGFVSDGYYWTQMFIG